MWFEKIFNRDKVPQTTMLEIPTDLEISEDTPRSDLYEMIQEVQRNKPSCNYVRRSPMDVYFLVTLQIPVGYKITRVEDYQLDITIDTQDLAVNEEEELRDAIVEVEDEQGQPQQMQCLVKVMKVKLRGTAFYNTIVGVFEAKRNLFSTKETYFTSNNSVPIEMVLGYSCYECNQIDNPLKEYATVLSKQDEFLVNEKGQVIPVTQSNEYFGALSNSNVTRIIQIP